MGLSSLLAMFVVFKMIKKIENPSECELREVIRSLNSQNVRPIEIHQTKNLRKFLMNFIKSKTPVCPDVLTNPVFQVLGDEGRAPRTLVLPSLNTRHHFFTFDSFITPSPYTAIS
jgi:hypothetical protein